MKVRQRCAVSLLAVVGDHLSITVLIVTFWVSGLIEAKTMTPARIALSIPLVNSLTHPLVSGPVLASHAFDLQDFPAPSNGPLTPVAHTGPPSVNIEAKLVGVEDDQVENGANPVGILFVRGPSVAKMANIEGYVDISSEGDGDGWIGTGVKAEVQPNGSFQVLSLGNKK